VFPKLKEISRRGMPTYRQQSGFPFRGRLKIRRQTHSSHFLITAAVPE
jgi:hypothetical protein